MAEPYVKSYYAATVNDQTRYPRLEGSVRADVCVVGGGFSGVATALSLAERGYSVVLLEASIAEASGRDVRVPDLSAAVPAPASGFSASSLDESGAASSMARWAPGAGAGSLAGNAR